MSLLFGVRGDIGKAVKYLHVAMKTKSDEVELYTELVAASYCKAERDDDAAALKLKAITSSSVRRNQPVPSW